MIHGWGRSPGGWNGNPFQYPCLGNHMDRGDWQATPWGCKELDTTKHAHTHTHSFIGGASG